MAKSLKETPGGIAPLPFLAPLTLNIFCARTSGMEAFVHKKLTMQGNLPWADNSLFLFFACLLPGRKDMPSPQLYYCVKSLRGWKYSKISILKKMFVKTILTSVWVRYCIFSCYDHLTMSETAFYFILLERGCKLYPQGQTKSPLFPLSRGNLSLHPGSCSSCDASEPLVRISHLWLWPPSPAFGTLRTCHKQRTILSHCHIDCHILSHIIIYCHTLSYCCILSHIVAIVKYPYFAPSHKNVSEKPLVSTL